MKHKALLLIALLTLPGCSSTPDETQSTRPPMGLIDWCLTNPQYAGQPMCQAALESFDNNTRTQEN